jgi:hypothetical protein
MSPQRNNKIHTDLSQRPIRGNMCLSFFRLIASILHALKPDCKRGANGRIAGGGVDIPIKNPSRDLGFLRCGVLLTIARRRASCGRGDRTRCRNGRDADNALGCDAIGGIETLPWNGRVLLSRL